MGSHLHSLVEDAAADLHHLQVLFLLVAGALDVGHPAALVLLAGVDEIAHGAVLVEHLNAQQNGKWFIISKIIQLFWILWKSCGHLDTRKLL